MKKLLLWLVMVVVMLAVLLGGAGDAMYAMTGDDKLPTQHPTLGDTELEPIGYDWSVPVLGNVLNRTFEQPSTLTVQKLGEMTEAAPELVLPDWAQRTNLTLKDSAGSVVVQGDAAAFAMYAYPKNGSYELTLTAYRNTADPGDATGWYRYCASYTMNIQPKAVLSSERVSQGGVAALVITGILDGSEPTVETDLGDVWFRPVTGGYMGYIPVTYNAEGGPHTLTVTCGSLTQELTLNVMQSEAKTVDVAAEADIPGAATEYKDAIWPLYTQGSSEKLWQGNFASPVPSAILADYGAYAGTLALTGGTVVIDHGCGVKSYLFGLDAVKVQRGQSLARGEELGTTSEEHTLIWELRIGSKSVDPAAALTGSSGLLYRETM